jgi:hypothetical protein
MCVSLSSRTGGVNRNLAPLCYGEACAGQGGYSALSGFQT